MRLQFLVRVGRGMPDIWRAFKDAADDDDESAGRPADLHRRATRCGDQCTGNEGGPDAGLRLEPGGNRKGRSHRQPDDAAVSPAPASLAKRFRLQPAIAARSQGLNNAR